MAARTPPSMGANHFHYIPGHAPISDPSTSAVGVLVDVMQALQNGDIKEARRIYDIAVEDGVFLDTLSVSYTSWNDNNSQNESIKKKIDDAIAKAVEASAKKNQTPSVVLDPAKKA